ncbi:MAG: hypothetical protein ACI4UE_02935 [Candidatus Scatovivens sp.]
MLTAQEAHQKKEKIHQAEIDRQMKLAENKIREALEENDINDFTKSLFIISEGTDDTVVYLGELAYPEVEKKLHELGYKTETRLVFDSPKTWIRF